MIVHVVMIALSVLFWCSTSGGALTERLSDATLRQLSDAPVAISRRARANARPLPQIAAARAPVSVADALAPLGGHSEFRVISQSVTDAAGSLAALSETGVIR